MSKPPLKHTYKTFFTNDFTLHHCRRWMTSSRRVQDRSRNKRVNDLEIAAEKHKSVSKILYIFELLKSEPEHIMQLRNLDRHRQQINLPKPHKFSDFLRKSPNLFEMYKDQRGTIWLGMTEKSEELVEEEQEIIEKNAAKAAEFVTRMLMMAADKRLQIDKIAHFRRDLGLPIDFRKDWVNNYPENFRVVRPKPFEDSEFLELVSWRSEYSITELEKTVLGLEKGQTYTDHVPGLLSLPFPLKFPSTYKKLNLYREKIANFQKREYLSPYADARGLEAGSLEYDKRAIAVMHELLSFSIDKRLVTDYFTHFRREFNMPQKLMRILLKHCGIFYVSERGKRFSAFLNEAYDGCELIEKHPLFVWREKVLREVGFGGRKKKWVESSIDVSDLDCEEDEDEDDDVELEIGLEDDGDGDEMDVEEVCKEYND